MSLPSSLRLRGVLVAGALLAATLGSSSIAAADGYPTVGGDEGSGELFGPPAAVDSAVLEALLLDVLAELDLSPEESRDLLHKVFADLTERVNDMIQEGVLTVAQVEKLGDDIDEGAFDDRRIEEVDAAQARRDAFRAAALAALEEAGVETPPDVPLRDLLREHDIAPEDLGPGPRPPVDAPPPGADGDGPHPASDDQPPPPVAPPPTSLPAASPTSPAPDSPTPQYPTTRPSPGPAPTPEYPSTTPEAPPPAPQYPATPDLAPPPPAENGAPADPGIV